MRDLAKGFRPDQLAKSAPSLYEQLRPAIPEGGSRRGRQGKLRSGELATLQVKNHR